MDKLYCVHCTAKYDTTEHSPKILPCLALKCLRCLKKDLNLSNKDEYIIHCIECSATHLVPSVVDLPTSEIVLHLVKTTNETQLENKRGGGSGEEEEDRESLLLPKKRQKLADFSRMFSEGLRRERFEIYKHYDHAIGDIDIRAEGLIQFVNQSRGDLQKRIKSFRDESLSVFSDEKRAPNETDEVTATSEIKKIKEELSNLSDDRIETDADLQVVVHESNKFQQYVHQLKKNLWYFTENSMKLESSLLGHTLNGKFDRNFMKIRNLTSLLTNSNSLNKISLASDFAQSVLRQEVLALNRVVKIYFTTYRTLHFEVFDVHGNLAKSLNAFEGKFTSQYGYYLPRFKNEKNIVAKLNYLHQV